MEPIEVEGQWWLPETPDTKIHGTLRIDEVGRAELALIGAVDSPLSAGEARTEGGETTVTFTEDSMMRSGVYARILGETQNHAWTLDKCMETSRRGRMFGGFSTQKIVADIVIRGAHFAKDEELAFSSIFVEMEGLAYWTMKTGIREVDRLRERSEDDYEQLGFTVSLERLPTEVIFERDGVTTALGQSYAISGDRVTERVIKQDFNFAVTSDRLRPLRDLLDDAGALQDLVSIGTDRVAAFKGVTFHHPDCVRKVREQTYHEPLDLYARWQARAEPPKRQLFESDMAFSMPQLSSEGLERWLEGATKHRSVLNRVMATRYSKTMYVSDKMFNCAAALEAYDRVRVNKADYVERVRYCASLAGAPFSWIVSDNVEPWVLAFKTARNDVAHHNARVSESPMRHSVLAESGYWLIVLCLLRDAQAPQAVFDNIMKLDRLRWLRRRVHEYLGADLST